MDTGPEAFAALGLDLSSISPCVNFAGLRLALVQLFVLAHTPPPGHKTRNNSKTGSRNDRSSAGLIEWLLGSQEEVGSKPMRDRGHAIGEGNQGRSLGARSGNNRSFPRQLDLQTRYYGNLVVRRWLHTFRPTNGPEQRRIKLKYRAPTFKVLIITTAPIRQTEMEPTICQQCSSMRPDDQETSRVTK